MTLHLNNSYPLHPRMFVSSLAEIDAVVLQEKNDKKDQCFLTLLLYPLGEKRSL